MVPLSTSTTSVPPELPDRVAARKTALGLLQPFSNDIVASWREASTDEEHVVPMHEGALTDLRTLAVEGRVILLNAPRAGLGKTHLLGRVAEAMRNDAIVVALPWSSAEGLAWEGTGRGLLNDLYRNGSNPSSLEKVCSGVCATLLRRLIQVGRIPSTDPAQALRVLAQDPMDLFRENGPAKVIGDWFRRHFDQLRKPMAEIAALDNQDEVEAWLVAMFEHLAKPGLPTLAVMLRLIEQEASAQVPRFLKLATIWRPLVLVADHLDGLYRDPQAGQTVARMILELTGLGSVRLVLSMNQDLWDTTFGRNLPSAFEDRLTARSLSLRGLDSAEARNLVLLRLRESKVEAEHGYEFLRFLDLERFFLGRPLGSVSARGLLRHAAIQWRFFVQGDSGFEKSTLDSNNVSLNGVSPEEDPLPFFESDDNDDFKRMAESLAHDAKGEQIDISGANLPPAPLPPRPANIVPIQQDSATIEAESFLQEPDEVTDFLAAPEISLPAGRSLLSEHPQNNFQKLRNMLAKIKVSTDSVPLAAGVLTSTAAAAPMLAPNPSPTHVVPPVEQSLQTRFEIIRGELSGHPPRMDWHVLAELIRLAGKRFAVVHYDEVELPGLLGRSLPRWSLQGMEIVFGLEDFSDERYWKTVSSFLAGRIAELKASTASINESAPELKLVVFKSEVEGGALSSLLKDDTVPPAVRPHVDIVHLDNRSLASLYAMRQLVREAEAGELSVNDPTAVLGALASELDFFWKRVTRSK